MKKYEKIRLVLFTLSGLFVSYFLILHVIHGSVFAKVITLCIASFFLIVLSGITYRMEQETKQKSNTIRQIIWVLFALYLFELVSFLFFENGFGRNGIGSIVFSKNVYRTYLNTSFNIIPFRVILFYLVGFVRGTQGIFHVIINLVGNFISFMPFALFLPLLFPKFLKSKYFIFFLSILVLVVELVQMLLLTGSCDIDDWILNVGGAVLLYFIFKKCQVYDRLKKVVD